MPIAISWPWSKDGIGRFVQLNSHIVSLESKGRYMLAKTEAGSLWRVYFWFGAMVAIRVRKADV